MSSKISRRPDGSSNTEQSSIIGIQQTYPYVPSGHVRISTDQSPQPAANLAEEFPEVSAYLESIAPSASAGQARAQTIHAPSQYAQEQASETLTSSLMDSVQDIMQRAEAEGRDPDAELREAVGRAVLQGVVTGYELGDAAQDTEDRWAGNGPPEQNGAKRPRMDDGSS